METTLFKEKDTGRKTAVYGLMAAAFLIAALGVGFGIYAALNGVSFRVMNSEIPGVIFAAVIAFLGVRYIIATVKLAKRVRGRAFSWKNFKLKKDVRERRD